jgi:hypothetical protein
MAFARHCDIRFEALELTRLALVEHRRFPQAQR